jgi:large subunit ribosomal protein L25
VPAVLYGHETEAQSLQVKARALDRLLTAGGAHSLVSLSVSGDKKPQTVLIREIQRYPTRPTVLHVDFYAVVMSEKLQTDVPLVIVGEAPAVVEGMAAMVQSLDSLQVECLPGDLPSSLELDVSGLERTDQNILVGDIPLPEGVTVLDDPQTVVISLAAARAEEEEEEELPLEALEAEDVEVLAKGLAARGLEGEEGAEAAEEG